MATNPTSTAAGGAKKLPDLPSKVLLAFLKNVADVPAADRDAYLVDQLVEWLDHAVAVPRPTAAAPEETVKARAIRIRRDFAAAFGDGTVEAQMRDALDAQAPPPPPTKPRASRAKKAKATPPSSLVGQWVTYKAPGVSQLVVGRVAADDGKKITMLVADDQGGVDEWPGIPRDAVTASDPAQPAVEEHQDATADALVDPVAAAGNRTQASVTTGPAVTPVDLVTPAAYLRRFRAIAGRERPAPGFKSHPDVRFEDGDPVAVAQYDVPIAGEDKPRRLVAYAYNADRKTGTPGHLQIVVLARGARTVADVDEAATSHEPIVTAEPGPYRLKIGRGLYDFTWTEGEGAPFVKGDLFHGD